MAIHTELPIYKDAYALLRLATEFTRHFPRDFKTLGQEIRDECIKIAVLIVRANAAFESAKAEHIAAMLERVEVVTMLMRLSHDMKFLSHDKWAGAMQLTTSVGKQASGWKKKYARVRQQSQCHGAEASAI